MESVTENQVPMEDKLAARFAELEEKIKNMPQEEQDRVRDAYTYAKEHHDGQLRKDGSPYITHPLEVAHLVADLGLDADSIIAALLHDTIEDTDATHEEVAKRFGVTVANLVEGVTKLNKVKYTSTEEKQMENLRKMLMAMAQDVRVILIKICDRVHNIRTLEYQSEKKQREKALETLEVYAPIAHRLGMQRMKWEMEDESLRFLDPVAYKEISDELAAQAKAHAAFMERIQNEIQDRLKKEGIKGTVYGRVKHVYSIYRKMYAQNKKLSEIFDLYAFRVIVDDIPTCYSVLGCIHDMYKAVLGRFKDYIGTPKPNMYQSLHTTVIGSEGIPFEVQIRTWEMHHMAEYGVAAHWKYKQGLSNKQLGTEETFAWVRRLLENQQDTEAEEYIRSLKVDLFADEVFVFPPGGDVINLPAGATPIDFAYAIHSAVGNSMTGAKVNGRIVGFDYRLRSGEIVEVITSKNAKGPSRDWMNLAKSNQARTKIRQWFKREKREENVAHGRTMFEGEIKRLGLTIAMLTTESMLPHILEKVRFNSLEEMYAAIGYGGASAQGGAHPPGPPGGRAPGRREGRAGGPPAGGGHRRSGLRCGQVRQQEALRLRRNRGGHDGMYGQVRQVLHPRPRRPHRWLHHQGLRCVGPPGGLSQRHQRPDPTRGKRPLDQGQLGPRQPQHLQDLPGHHREGPARPGHGRDHGDGHGKDEYFGHDGQRPAGRVHQV